MIRSIYFPSKTKTDAYLKQLLQSLASINVANFLPQHLIQQLAQRVRQGCGEDHKEFCDVDGFGTNGEPISGANGLWDDLTEDDDGEGGARNCNQAGGQVVHQYGEGRIHEDIAEEEAAEEKVAVVPDRSNALSVGFFRLGAGIHDNLEVRLVEGHET